MSKDMLLYFYAMARRRDIYKKIRRRTTELYSKCMKNYKLKSSESSKWFIFFIKVRAEIESGVK